MESSQYEELRKQLECPVCYTYIPPPVRQCCNNHAICAECFSKVAKCPVCRQDKVQPRNSVLEHLYLMLDIPCKYRAEGCAFSAKGARIAEHQGACAYRPVACPALSLEVCHWTGPESTVAEHCRTQHNSAIVFGPEAQLQCTEFRNASSCKYLTLFAAFSLIFRLYWDVDPYSGDVRFSMTYKDTVANSHSYSFKVRFLNRRGVTRSLHGRCMPVTSDMHLMVPEGTAGANFDHVAGFCNKTGELRFNVKIWQDCAGPKIKTMRSSAVDVF